MWEPLEYPGSCFDFHFGRFEGLMFETEKTLGNVCAAGAFPVAGVSFSTFVRFHSLSHRILLLSLSMNLQRLNELCCWMEWPRKKRETVITLKS